MNKLFFTLIFALIIIPGFGQNNTNSPYSVFGIGELDFTGGGRNIGMGSTGVALRSNLFLNSVNPASLTAIDPKSLGFDMGFNMKLSNLENTKKTVNVLNGNISWLQIAFPITSNLTAAISMNPKSSVGYTIYSTKPFEGTNGTYPVLYTGTGGLSETAISLGLKCFKNLSVGATTSFLWGDMNKQTEEFTPVGSISSILENRDIRYTGVSVKTGFQYYKDLTDKVNFTLGGTADFSGNLNSTYDLTISEVSSSATTAILTEKNAHDDMNLPVKFGLGMALGFNHKTTFTLDYNRSDWTNANVNLSSKKLNINNSFHFGAEFSPKYDAGRTGESMKYRVGALYQTGYINVYGIPIDSYAVTLGMSVPIRRDRSSLNFSLEAGRQGTLQKLMVRESYLKLNCSFNLWERWFVKRAYD